MTRLASASPLYIIADSFRICVSSVHGIILEICLALKTTCKDVFIWWPSPSQMQVISENFETLYGIHFVVGAIDGSHIPIVEKYYYCKKIFHSLLL